MRLPTKTARWKRCVPRLALINVWISRGFYLHSLQSSIKSVILAITRIRRRTKSFRPVPMSLPKSKVSVSILIDRVMVSRLACLAVSELYSLSPTRDVDSYSEHFRISRQRKQTDEKKKVSENVFRRARRNRFIQFERLQAS